MIIKTGNLWNEDADVILVTTNSVVNAKGQLVMGRGAALQAASRFPGLALQLGRKVCECHGRDYGIIILPQFVPGLDIGAFQVKRDWRAAAILEIIAFSTRKLLTKAVAAPSMKFVMNFPGIGNGRLKESQVLPIISELPDNVAVYSL